MHEALGTLVAYTPPHHSASLGGVERSHKDLKVGLKAALIDMGNQYQDQWMDILPWVLLARRTTYQPTLDATPAELVLGGCVKIPGDLVSSVDPPFHDISQLLIHLQKKVDREPS